MKLGESYKNPDTGKLEVSIINIKDDEIVWLRSAVKAHQDKNDDDDFNALKRARDWMDTVHEAFKLLRP